MSQPESTIFTCPSCGSPIEMGETSGTCSYCNTVVERRGGAPEREPIVITRGAPSPRPVRKSSSGGGAGCVIALLVGVTLFVVFMIGATTLSLRQVGSVFGIGYHGWPLFKSERIADILMVAPRDAAGDDLLVLLQQGQDLTLGLIDSTGSTLRWQTAPLSKNARQSALAIGGDMVYLVDQTRLQALRLSDGATAWQASLSVEPQSGCDGCLMVLDNRVLVLQKDRTLQSFDARTGQPGWGMRLADAPQRIPVVGRKLALVQPSEGQSDPEIRLIDPATGAVTQRISPTCTRGEDESANFYASSPLLASPDGSALFTVLDGSHDCMQRWNPSSDAPAWQTWLEDGVAPSYWDAHRALFAGQRLLIANDGRLSSLDTATGALTTLLRDDDYKLTPLFARGATAVVIATPNWDANRHSLWAIDADSGERRWQYDLQAREWFGDSGFNEWGAQLTPDGVTVVQVPDGRDELIVERLDLQSGVSAGRQITKLDDDSPTVWENRWTDRMAWLDIDSKLYTIDLLSGAVTSRDR